MCMASDLPPPPAGICVGPIFHFWAGEKFTKKLFSDTVGDKKFLGGYAIKMVQFFHLGKGIEC